jgi:hypothetical protein
MESVREMALARDWQSLSNKDLSLQSVRPPCSHIARRALGISNFLSSGLWHESLLNLQASGDVPAASRADENFLPGSRGLKVVRGRRCANGSLRMADCTIVLPRLHEVLSARETGGRFPQPRPARRWNRNAWCHRSRTLWMIPRPSQLRGDSSSRE